MLYDILPPLFLLASFGGIAVILSRVVVRVQQQRLSQEIKAHAASNQVVPSEDLLRSRGEKISVVKNRLALIPQGMASIKESVQAMKEARREKKEQKQVMRAAEEKMAAEEKAVIQPTPGRFTRLRAGMQSVAEQGKHRLQQIRQRRQEAKQVQAIAKQTAPVTPVPGPAAAAAKVLVRRVEHSDEQTATSESDNSKTARASIGSMLQRKKQDQHPLNRAASCLKQSQYDKAEDILLPYIVRHARDTKAYMLLGRAAVGRGDWEEAVEIFQQVRAIDSQVPGLFASLGRAAYKAGRMTLAIEMLQKARDVEPGNIPVREQLLTIAQHIDNKVLARSVAEELRELRQEQAPAEAK